MKRPPDRSRARLTFRFLVFAIALVVAPLAVSAQSMRCESPDGSYRECRVGSNGRVRLVLEISNRRCNEDLSWGTASEGVVWVSGGCSAVFKVETGLEARGGQSGKRVVCESLYGKLKVCRADGSRGVNLVRQLGAEGCVKGTSWGENSERAEIWVDHGCRGEFVLGNLSGTPTPDDPLAGRVVCESAGKKRNECPADTSAGVQIVKELGEKRCEFGRDWGYEPSKIWVSRGCRAEFAVRGRPLLSTVTCEAEGREPVRCLADAKAGVALVSSYGEAPCALGSSWGFDDEGVWVSNGCRAKFALGGFRIDESAVPGSALRIGCASEAGGRSVCPANTSHGVGLIRETGEAACVLNRTWGYDDEGIWVSDGCRGEFAVAR